MWMRELETPNARQRARRRMAYGNRRLPMQECSVEGCTAKTAHSLCSVHRQTPDAPPVVKAKKRRKRKRGGKNERNRTARQP